MNYFNVTLVWIGKPWKQPAMSIKIEGLAAEDSFAARKRVLGMFATSTWKIVEVTQL